MTAFVRWTTATSRVFAGLARVIGHGSDPLRLSRQPSELGQGERHRIDPTDAAVFEACQHGARFPPAQAHDRHRPEPLAGQLERGQVEAQQVARFGQGDEGISRAPAIAESVAIEVIRVMGGEAGGEPDCTGRRPRARLGE